MDKLEQFILDNRSDFDEKRPSEKGWNKLDEKLSKKQVNWGIYWKVAAVLFFCCTLVLSVMMVNKEPAKSMANSQTLTLEGFFVTTINQKLEEYGKLAQNEESAEFFEDLAMFDLAYQDLAVSFKEVQSEAIAEAMLENLRLRILLVTEQIEQLKRDGYQQEVFHSS